MTTDAYPYDAIRTPRGRGREIGSLHRVKPVSPVVGLIGELRRRHPDLDPARIDDLVLGVVSPVGDQGMDIAKAASLVAGLPDHVAGVRLNRFCASGLEAVNTAAQEFLSGWDQLIVAGGWSRCRGCRWEATGVRWPLIRKRATRPRSFRTAAAPNVELPAGRRGRRCRRRR